MEIKEIFDQSFKFKVNDSVRHKGDNKNGLHSDMGLLILKRIMEESKDDDDGVHFNRIYHCRMIRYSNSGDIQAFKESELLSISEYNDVVLREEEDRERKRAIMYETKNEIFKSFGVERGSEVLLIKDGEVDESIIYKVTGYKADKNGTELHLRIEAGEGRSIIDEIHVMSKSEFVLKSAYEKK